MKQLPPWCIFVISVGVFLISLLSAWMASVSLFNMLPHEHEYEGPLYYWFYLFSGISLLTFSAGCWLMYYVVTMPRSNSARPDQPVKKD